ncbi:hypothetical protein D3C71_1693100 [compost metagenome]
MYGSAPVQQQLLQIHDNLIHERGDNRDDEQAGHHQREIEHLKTVDDQVSQTRFRHQKFADDDTNPGHADINLKCRDNSGE